MTPSSRHLSIALLTLTLFGCGSLARMSSIPDGGASGREAAQGDSGPSDGPATDGEDPSPTDAPITDDCNALTSCNPGAPCPGGGCCVAGICVLPGERCAMNLPACDHQSCGGCGAMNEPCCIGQAPLGGSACGLNPPGSAGWWDGPACSDPNAACVDAGAEAESNRCVACGAAGQPCCTEGLEKAPLGICGAQLVCGSDGTCSTNCGEVGQPCCDDSPCREGSVCILYPTGSNVCVAGSACGADGGTCTTCGITGLPCCAEEGCEEGICASGKCYVNTMR